MSVFQNIYKTKLDELKSVTSINDAFTADVLYREYENIFQNTFRWTLPDNIFKKLPEIINFNNGMYAGFIDNGQFKIYPCYPNGILEEDGRYSTYTIIAFNGKTWHKTREDIVIGSNTSNCESGRTCIYYYIEKMWECLQTINNLVIEARMNTVFACKNEADVLKLTNAYNSAKKNEPIIAFLSSFDEIEKQSVYDAKQTEILQIFEVYNKFKSELDNVIGFHNIDNFKRERLTVNETECNNDIVHFGLLGDMINNRDNFVQACWEKFPEYVNKDNFSFRIERDVHTSTEKEINGVKEDVPPVEKEVTEDGNKDDNV